MNDPYNYLRFKAGHYDFEHFPGPEVGGAAVDFGAETLDGKKVRLSDFFGSPVVLETGSLTCGVYVGKIVTMQAIAARHPEATFLILYAREAHPGERVRPHKSLDDKRRLAQRLAAEEAENRIILIDGVDGEAHRAYGSFPNMVYIFDANGTVASRQTWNDPSVVEEVLEALKAGRAVSSAESRAFVPAFGAHVRTLWRAGWLAIFDFLKAAPKLFCIHYVKRR